MLGVRRAFIAAVYVVVNYLKRRMEIRVLNAETCMDSKSSEYVDLCKVAVCAVKQV